MGHRYMLSVKSWHGRGNQMSRRDRFLSAKQFNGPRKCSCDLDLSQMAQAGQLEDRSHWGRQGNLTLLDSPIACVYYYLVFEPWLWSHDIRQHISYKSFLVPESLDKFPASRQIEAHNHDDLWHSLASPSYK